MEEKAEIDYSDCEYSIEAGVRMRRSLVRYFLRFLDAQIVARGFNAQDGKLFDHEQIEDEAWELADQVLREIKGRVGASIREEYKTAPEVLALILPGIMAEIERNFLAPHPAGGGLDLLIEFASGHLPEGEGPDDG